MMTEAAPLIEVRHLVRRYGEHDVLAVADVSFEIRAGEFVALMGPSGCGKSTLLNILGTLDRPTSGLVRIAGEDVFAGDDAALTAFRRRRLGFVFQFFNLLATLTVLENVMLPLELDAAIPAGHARKRASDLLEKVKLSQRADFFPAQLSGGEMQRVAIARALVHEPAIILADEPTGNLDTENGLAVLALLREMTRNAGQVVLMATHSEEAAARADRVIRMRDGRLLDGAVPA